jgi:hypothetical protein
MKKQLNWRWLGWADNIFSQAVYDKSSSLKLEIDGTDQIDARQASSGNGD